MFLKIIYFIKNSYLLFFLKYVIIYKILKKETKQIKIKKIVKPTLDKSFIRWGDGETLSVLGLKLYFQTFHYKLSELLKKIIEYKGDKILLGLPIRYIVEKENNTNDLKFWKLTRFYLKDKINNDREYGDSLFFRDMISIDDFINFYKGKKLFFISNENTIKKIIENNIENIGTYIIPNNNAFNDYKNIKNKILFLIKDFNKNDTIIIVSGGPFAKALCYDLTNDYNFICHDVGAVFDIHLKNI